MVYRLLCSSAPHIFLVPRENSLTIFTCENVFELQSLLHYQAYCTGKYSNSIYKSGVIFNSHKSGQQDTAVPFLAGFWFKILTIGSHLFLVHIWLPTRKINSCLVSLMMWENVNEVLCWKHLPGVGIGEITKTLSQLLEVEATVGPRAGHQLLRPRGKGKGPQQPFLPQSLPQSLPCARQQWGQSRRLSGCHPPL